MKIKIDKPVKPSNKSLINNIKKAIDSDTKTKPSKNHKYAYDQLSNYDVNLLKKLSYDVVDGNLVKNDFLVWSNDQGGRVALKATLNENYEILEIEVIN